MLHFYTDGSTIKNPGTGGWAFVAVDDIAKIIEQKSGKKTSTTNNRMELTAFLASLVYAKKNAVKKFEIVSDSRYCVDGCSKWLRGWRAKNFNNVKNDDIWQEISTLLTWLDNAQVSYSFRWVRGHNGHQYNEIADKLAFNAARF